MSLVAILTSAIVKYSKR